MDTTYEAPGTRVVHDATGRPLIRWGAVFGGAVMGLALLGLLSALWLALAYGSNIDRIAANIEWYLAGSAIACMFVAGILAGYLSGVRGTGPGVLHGLTVWGLLLIVTVTVGIPAILNLFGVSRVVSETNPATLNGADRLWTGFWTLVIAFGTSGLGGLIGGLTTRDLRQVVATPSVAQGHQYPVPEHRHDEYQEREPATPWATTPAREPTSEATAVRHDRAPEEPEDRRPEVILIQDEDGAYRDENGRPVTVRQRASSPR